ncbi:MAG: hypothetical protein ACTSPV_05400 [Candidatus Hodarchaeales archaeon]
MSLQQNQVDFSDPVTLILLIISVILLAIILYLGTRLIAGKKETDTGYIIRLLLVSTIIVILVALVIGAVVGVVASIPFVNEAVARLVPVLIFVAIVYLIKYLLIPEKGEVTKWNASIWIAVISLFLVYLFNAITLELFNTTIIFGVA